MAEIISWAQNNLGWLIVILTSIIQISPIKLNPWTSIFKWIGQAINGDVVKRLDKIDARIDEQEKNMNNNEKDRIRWEVLEFANSCKNGRKHTQDEYRHIFKISDKYHKIIEENNETNGYFTVEYDYIKKDYQTKCTNGDFLL